MERESELEHLGKRERQTDSWTRETDTQTDGDRDRKRDWRQWTVPHGRGAQCPEGWFLPECPAFPQLGFSFFPK